MKKFLPAALLALALLAAAVFPAFAADGGAPQGTCPTGFTLMMMDPNMDPHDYHIGLKTDLNGDGLICMMVLQSGLHVHMDNVLP